MSTKFILSCSFDNGAFEEFDTEQEFLKAIQQLIRDHPKLCVNLLCGVE